MVCIMGSQEKESVTGWEANLLFDFETTHLDGLCMEWATGKPLI